jgi:glyoxylase I family protein
VAAVDRLTERGVPHGEVMDLAAFGIAILSFEDPDGVHLELTAPL